METRGRQLSSLSYPHKHEGSTLADSCLMKVNLRREKRLFVHLDTFFSVFLRSCPELPGQSVPLEKEVMPSKAY